MLVLSEELFQGSLELRKYNVKQSCIEFKKFTRSSNELTFNSSSKFPSLSFMNKRKERNFELELKVSSIELLLNFLNFIQLCTEQNQGVSNSVFKVTRIIE